MTRRAILGCAFAQSPVIANAALAILPKSLPDTRFVRQHRESRDTHSGDQAEAAVLLHLPVHLP